MVDKEISPELVEALVDSQMHSGLMRLNHFRTLSAIADGGELLGRAAKALAQIRETLGPKRFSAVERLYDEYKEYHDAWQEYLEAWEARCDDCTYRGSDPGDEDGWCALYKLRERPYPEECQDFEFKDHDEEGMS